MSRLLKRLVTGLAAVTLLATQVHAQLSNMTYSFSQVGNDVVITGRGSFNTAGITPGSYLGPQGGVFGNPAPGANGTYQLYSTESSSFFFEPVFNTEDLSSVVNFFPSPNVLTAASSVVGTNGFIIARAGAEFGLRLQLYAPVSYQSGTPLSTSMTFNNTTLAAWGLEIGKSAAFSYAATADGPALGTITLEAVPEPSALLLVGSVAGACLVRRRRR